MNGKVKIILIIVAVLLLLGGASFLFINLRKKKKENQKDGDKENSGDVVKTKEQQLYELSALKEDLEGKLKDEKGKLAALKYNLSNAEKYYTKVPTPPDATEKYMSARQAVVDSEGYIRGYESQINEIGQMLMGVS